MVMTRINGRDYPMRSEPKCRTCQSPHREFIERELVAGRSYRAIAKQLEGLPEGAMAHPSDHGIGEHVRGGHLPVPHEQRRDLVEQRAKAIGKSIETDHNLVDYVAVNQMILHRGFERLQAGEIEPDTKDLLTAIATLHKIETTSPEGYDVEAYQEAMFVYMDVAQRFIPPEVFEEYGAALRRNPILRAIAAKQAAENTVSGEVEDTAD